MVLREQMVYRLIRRLMARLLAEYKAAQTLHSADVAG
jgi:hypothetical protein